MLGGEGDTIKFTDLERGQVIGFAGKEKDGL